MYDLTDLIFEKYAEGKLSEEKMILLLEANKDDEVFKQELESFEVIPDIKTTDRDKKRNADLKKELEEHRGDKIWINNVCGKKCYEAGQKRPITKFEYSLAKRYVDNLIKTRKGHRQLQTLAGSATAFNTVIAVRNGTRADATRLHKTSAAVNGIAAAASLKPLYDAHKMVKDDKKSAEEARQRLQNKKNKKY